MVLDVTKKKMASKKKTKTRVKEFDLDIKIVGELGGDKVIYLNLNA